MVLPNATSGMMSVRPHLAGSASGIGGAIMTAGGAAFAATTGALLTPETGAIPLIAIMFGTSILPVFCVFYIQRRETLQLAD